MPASTLFEKTLLDLILGTIPISTFSSSGSGPYSVTFTISGLNFDAGGVVTVSGVASTGTAPNGTFTITSVGANTFTVSVAANPGTYSSGGAVTSYSPSTNLGLFAASTWAASTSYSVGNFVVGTAFNSGSNSHIFQCTASVGGHLSGSSEPTWNQALGGTTADNNITWTEFTPSLESNTLGTLEPSVGSYARAAIPNNTSNWGPATVGSSPSVLSNIATINFGTSTASWGQIVGFGIFGNSGNLLIWGYFNSTQTVNTATTPSFGPGNLTFSLT